MEILFSFCFVQSPSCYLNLFSHFPEPPVPKFYNLLESLYVPRAISLGYLSGHIYLTLKLQFPQQKDKEDLEDVSTELELADEDELVPYVTIQTSQPFFFPGSWNDLILSGEKIATRSAIPSCRSRCPKPRKCSQPPPSR